MVVSADVHDEEECSIGGKVGLLLGNSCYVVMTSSGLSWFKAVSHCASLGASLANAVGIHSKWSVSQLADYLSLSGLDGQPLWIGLSRRPWAWVQTFDPGKNHLLSCFLCDRHYHHQHQASSTSPSPGSARALSSIGQQPSQLRTATAAKELL